MSNGLQSIIDERGPIKTIGVVGMGYVGIPAAVLFADAPEFESVLGFQRDSASSGYKVDMLNRGSPRSRARSLGLRSCLQRSSAPGSSGAHRIFQRSQRATR